MKNYACDDFGKLFYNSDGVWQESAKFFYNNFTLIEESTADNTITKEFVWNPIETIATRPLTMKCNVQNSSLLYTHDANKNVTEVLYLATTNGLAAHYEYSPFGELRDFSHLSSTPETSNSEVNAIAETSNSDVNAIAEISNYEVNAITETSNSDVNAIIETSNSDVNAITEISNSDVQAITETSNSDVNAIIETSNSEVNAITETLSYGHLASSQSLSPETNVITETLNSSNYSPGDLIGWRDTPITEIDIRTFNPFQFSSEYHDDELSLIYYNYRHYNPATGRFLSRDPIEEQNPLFDLLDNGFNDSFSQFLNLYLFIHNDSINDIDYLGLKSAKRISSSKIQQELAKKARQARNKALRKFERKIKNIKNIKKVLTPGVGDILGLLANLISNCDSVTPVNSCINCCTYASMGIMTAMAVAYGLDMVVCTKMGHLIIGNFCFANALRSYRNGLNAVSDIQESCLDLCLANNECSITKRKKK